MLYFTLGFDKINLVQFEETFRSNKDYTRMDAQNLRSGSQC